MADMADGPENNSGTTEIAVPPEGTVAAVFDYAGLAVPPERLAENYELYSSTLALIRQASVPGLGETVPAVGFNANWH